MDNKNIFGKTNFSRKKVTYYIVAVLCIGAIALVSYLSYQTLSAKPAPEPTPEISDPANTKKTDVVEPKDPEPEPEPEVEPEPQTQSPAPAPEVTVSQKPYIMPVKDATISASFSLEIPVYSQTLGDWRIHDGIDIAAALGTEVVAANDGVVESIECHDLYGITVVLKHTDGKKTTYSNLEDSIELEQGQVIEQGNIVGKIGQTAVFEIAEGPHLHFEMSQNGEKIDPTEIIQN